jgi:hypothetical protein
LQKSIALLEKYTRSEAFAAFKSMVQTLTKRGIDSMVEGLYHISSAP